MLRAKKQIGARVSRSSTNRVRQISLEEIEKITRNQFSADGMITVVAAARGKKPQRRIVDPGPDPSDEEAIDHLCKMLIRAREVRDRHPDKNRLAAIFALDAVLFFLMRVRESQTLQLTSCLGELHRALVDLELGAAPPFLRLKPKRSRRPDPSDRQQIKGAVAASMSLLMKFGQTREEAARLIAAELRRNGVKLSGGQQLNWGTVASWRDQVRRAAPSQSEASFCYRLLIDGGMQMGMPALPADMEHERRERFVRDLRHALSGLVNSASPKLK
jgi:hypothetical protein